MSRPRRRKRLREDQLEQADHARHEADRGSIIYNDGIREIDVLALKGQALRDFRPRLQMIFQDPVSSLSPRMTVLNIIREPLEIHGIGGSGRTDQTGR